jgi:nitroreductase
MGNSQSFLGNVTWRRAVKSFAPVDGFFNVSGIEYAIVNAPSSFGLQPYTVLAVRNQALKEKLKAVSFDQPQVSTCSVLYIFCAHTDVNARAEEYLKRTGAETIRGMLMGFLAGISDKVAWATKQAYIALGFGLAAAAELKIASCPMEGFMPSEVAKILELPETLVPCVYLAVGRESADGGAPFPRFRFPETDLVKRYD